MPLRLDCHQHFWQYEESAYPWIDDSMDPLRRDFLPADLASRLAEESLHGTVAVQARQTLDETRWLVELASEMPALIHGVVGWAPIASPRLPAILDELCAMPRLVGLRHIVETEAPGFLLSSDFARGMHSVREHGLTYDLLIHAEQLEEATHFVDAHPDQIFVLDHMAKPDIKHAAIEPWASRIQQLAKRENVACKVSGLVTEADWACWTPETLQPFFEVVLAAFGPARLMAGSDWPVLTVACSYKRWWATLRRCIEPLSETERDAILGTTAARVYGLPE